MLINWKPKKFKFKCLQKSGVKKMEHRTSAINCNQGAFGLKILKDVSLTQKQLEEISKKIVKLKKKRSKQKFWFHTLPDTPLTFKSANSRMGKGKGTVERWIHKAPAGKLIFQVNLIKKIKVMKIFKSMMKILPTPAKILINPMMMSKKKIKLIKFK